MKKIRDEREKKKTGDWGDRGDEKERFWPLFFSYFLQNDN